MNTWIIDLEPWEVEHAARVGAGRVSENEGKADAASYQGNQHRMLPEPEGNIKTATCELAVAKFVNQYWSGSVWEAGKHEIYRDTHADVGHDIEVKMTRQHNSFSVKRKELGRGLTVWVAKEPENYPDITQVEIVGCMEVDRAWELGEDRGYANTRYTSFDHLHTALDFYMGVQHVGC